MAAFTYFHFEAFKISFLSPFKISSFNADKMTISFSLAIRIERLVTKRARNAKHPSINIRLLRLKGKFE